MAKLFSLGIIAVLTTLLLAACGGGNGEGSGSNGGGGTMVNVTLFEWSLVADRTTVPAGDVTFNVENSGFVEHEMVILRTDLPADGLVMKSPELTLGQGTEADEEASGTLVGRIPAEDPTTELQEILFPRDSESATFNMAPGHYVLICNRPTHYELLQYVDFTVE